MVLLPVVLFPKAVVSIPTLLVRVTSAALAGWGVGLVVAATGRYRWFAGFATWIAIDRVPKIVGLNTLQHGPFAMLTPDLGMSAVIHWVAVAHCFGWLAVGLAFGWAVLSLNGGSFATRLARPMSVNERMFTVLVFICGALFVFQRAEMIPDPPYEPRDATLVETSGQQVYLVGDHAEDEGREVLANELAQLGGAFAEKYELPDLMVLGYEPRKSSVARPLVVKKLHGARGFKVIIHESHPYAHLGEVLTRWYWEMLVDRSEGALAIPDLQWLGLGTASLEGWRVDHERVLFEQRAVVATEQIRREGLGLLDLVAASDVLPLELQHALAGALVETVRELTSEDQVQDELARWLDDPLPGGISGDIELRRRRPGEVLRRLGLSLAQIEAALTHKVVRWRRDHAEQLGTRPKVEGALSVTPLSGDGRLLRLRAVEVENLTDDDPVWIQWELLGPVDRPLSWRHGERKRVRVGRLRDGINLPGAFVAHNRVAWTLEVDDPALQAKVRLPWRRESIQ